MSSPHPFAATLSRTRGRVGAILDPGPRLRARGEEWTALATLTEGGGLGALVERVRDAGTGSRRDVAAVWFLESLVEAIAGPAIAPLALERRLLDLEPRGIMLRFDADGYPVGWGVREPRFRVITGDPDSDHADVVGVAEHEGALLTVLRAQLEEALAPIVDALHAIGRRSRRALWRATGDVLASAFLNVGKAANDVDRATELGRRCLALEGPMRVATNYQAVELPAGRVIARVRNGCCLNHVVEPGRTCLPCPLTPAAERLRRLEARM